MRRVFIIRKDLRLTPGKLAATVAHCSEAYWIRLMRTMHDKTMHDNVVRVVDSMLSFPFSVREDVFNEYVLGMFTKTICECKNKDALKKAIAVADEFGLVEDEDYSYINDKCMTELTPENDDGTCTVGMWFRPLEDDIAHKISKKFKLYGVFDKPRRNCDMHLDIDEARKTFENSIDSLRMHFDEWLYAPFSKMSHMK